MKQLAFSQQCARRGKSGAHLVRVCVIAASLTLATGATAQQQQNNSAALVSIISLLLDDPEPGFVSCAFALQAGMTEDGVYPISPDGAEAPVNIYCDQTTDGGGWTLVGSTQTTTLRDEASGYYPDLQTLAPAGPHTGIWDGLRDNSERWDVRFACRASVEVATAPMDVDLSFYDVNWYTEFTTGTDADSCFSEANGLAADSPVPARRDNILDRFRRKTDAYNSAGYLEGEDQCNATTDFTVDFDDRGMDSDQSDGTDWGEDDTQRKCGVTGLSDGQWFVFVRERPRVAVIGLSQAVAELLRNDQMLVDELSYDGELPAKITTENYDTIVIGRYATVPDRMTQQLKEALAVFGRNGGNVVTEWEGATIFVNDYAANFRYTANVPAPLGWFDDVVIGSGSSLAPDTPITQSEPADPIFEGVADPFSAGGATQFFFTLTEGAGTETLATFQGDGTANFPSGPHPGILRGRYCAGNFIAAPFDWQDDPANPGFGNLIVNMVREASKPPNPSLPEYCPDSHRAEYAVCGSTNRDPASFGVKGNRVNTCAPSSDTQMMFVTRTGITNFEAQSSATLRDYVQNGGIIIGEFSISDNIHNHLFNDAVEQGPRIGACDDAVMPQVQQSPENGFWQDNLFLPPANNSEGCGHDISALPGIVPLGGWSADTVQLAYRDVGQGRVWYVESDWQDGSVSFTERDAGLMNYMLSHRAGGLYGSGAILSGALSLPVQMHNVLADNYQFCLQTPYNSSIPLDEILDSCSGSTLVMACRQTGAETTTVFAMGARDEVFEDVGDGNTSVNPHNGVNWYFSENRSLGFANGGDNVNRNSCDTVTTDGSQRLCWHTSSSRMNSGWRCGTQTNINNDTWERVILHRDGDTPN